jgi:hypothetical protein
VEWLEFWGFIFRSNYLFFGLLRNVFFEYWRNVDDLRMTFGGRL